MRYAVRRIRLWTLLGVFTGTMLCIVGSHVIRNITRVHTYTLHADPLFSDTLRAVIEQSIANVPLHSSLGDYAQHLAVLQAEHISIASYVITVQIPHSAQLHIYAHRPCLVVNETYCITEEDTAYACADMRTSVLETLPTLTVHDYQHENQELNRQLVSWIKVLPQSLLRDYQLLWRSTTERYIQSKGALPSYTIVCADVPLTESLLDACLQSMRQQQKITSSTAYHWTADVRFAHQIIVKKEPIRKIMEG